jgi:hypothetical protein
MGLNRMGPPESLVELLARQFEITTFVETGTYYGNTAAWAASQFQKVYTIEKSFELSEKANHELKKCGNVTVLNTDSPRGLRQLAPQISDSCLFWLDAHWSGGITAGAEQQCPLLDEIAAVQMFAQPKAVLIDDARLFLSTPQPPHDPDQWPEISEVVSALTRTFPKNYLAIIEDAIVCVPESMGDAVRAYCRNVNELAWKAYGETSRREQVNRQSQTKRRWRFFARILDW